MLILAPVSPSVNEFMGRVISVKRKDFIRHLETNGCVFAREGARHTVFVNTANKKTSSVPRTKNDLKKGLVLGVCRWLEIPSPL
jgi:mRNA interferase HicA